MDNNIHNRIRELRKLREWSQKDLADKIGVIQTHVSKWENGMIPSAQSLSEIAQAFGVPVTELYKKASDSQNSEQDATQHILQYLKEHLSTDQLARVANLTQNLNDNELAQLIAQFAQTPPESRKAVLTLLGDKNG